MSKEKEQNKVKLIQRYTFEIIHYKDGHLEINRKNENFSVIEMIGISEIIKENVIGVFKGAIKPADEVNIQSTNSPVIHSQIN